ncbi:hypothetical protein ACJMK2_026267 [Sinanodonta woodiana]|uniref:Histone-binding protein RBBP4-like N-terminal domain-containing protein n=1 Tax=Sinanodonta woodiana TaxID=1069815 RepID=A0ABD3XLX8_SINWO
MTEQEGRLRLAEEEILSGEDNNIDFHDLLVRHTLEAQSLTIQWLPDVTRLEGEDYSLHRLILGTFTGYNQQNYLLIAGVQLPHKNYYELDNSVSVKWNIEKKINHQGEVNKASYNPQNPCLIATNNSSSDVLVFDWTKQPSVPDPSRKCTPELILKGHTQEGYGLSWNPILNGRIISSSNDTTICLWDVNTTPTQGGTIDAMNIFTNHTSIVNDVAWHPSHQTMFGSVADDKKFIIWDTRLSRTTHVVHSHSAAFYCLSFNPTRECIMATGSADEHIAVWDIRYLSRKLYSIKTFQDANYQVHWSPHNEKILASSGTDRFLYFWDLSNINGDQSPFVDAICCEHDGDIFEFSWNLNEPWLISSVSEHRYVSIWQSAEHDYQQSLNVVR